MGSYGIRPAYFCMNCVSTSLIGSLRTMEDVLFICFLLWKLLFSQKLPVELVVFGAHDAFWKVYIAYI